MPKKQSTTDKTVVVKSKKRFSLFQPMTIDKHKHPKLAKIQKTFGFYAKQSIKAMFILAVFYMPIDILNNYINTIRLNISNMNTGSYFVATAKMDYLSMLAGLSMMLGVYFVITKLNWSMHKADMKAYQKEKEKQALIEFEKQQND